MRIVYLIARSDSIGGYHIHVRDLALAVQARGDEPIVLMGQDGPYVQEMVSRGIAHHTLPNLIRAIHPWRDAAAFLELRRLLQRIKPDLVSTHGAKSGALGRVVAGSLGIPVITTAHGWSFTTGVPKVSAFLYRWLERLTMRSAARVIGVSDYDRQLALKYGVASPDQLITIHNGMPDVSTDLRAQPQRSPPRLVMVARFEAQKDHATLLNALAGLKDSAWELELIGDGPLRPSTEELAAQLGIADRVQFLGARRDVAERLAEAQVFLLISNWEGFPRTILEAMRAGLPVVASAVGGAHESVVDGETGLLVPRADRDTLRDRLRSVISDPERRADLGRAGRQRFEQHFTFETMLQKTLAIYDEVVGSGEPLHWRSKRGAPRAGLAAASTSPQALSGHPGRSSSNGGSRRSWSALGS